MRLVRSAIIIAFVLCASGLRAEPLQLAAHWAIYLPETDEVEFRAQFDREPDFPNDHLSIAVFPQNDGIWHTKTAAIWSRTIMDGTIGIERYGPGMQGDVGTEVGRFPFAINDSIFSVTIPFGSLNVTSHEFYYGAFANIGGSYRNAQVGVPEPTTLSLAAAGIFFLAVASSQVGWAVPTNAV